MVKMNGCAAIDSVRPLLITCQLRNALGKQCSCLYTRAFLLWNCPKPLNDFREIGCAPTELNYSVDSSSFWGNKKTECLIASANL